MSKKSNRQNQERAARVISTGNANLQTPASLQLAILGFSKSRIQEYAQKDMFGLDIGCGGGGLVESLKSRGVRMEGIDGNAPNSPDYIKQNVYSISPAEGCIPRHDAHYDFVVSFQNGCVNRAVTYGGVIRNPALTGGDERDMRVHEKAVRSGLAVIFEALRVVKPGGPVILYPDCSLIEENIGRELGRMGVDISHQNVDAKAMEEFFRRECEIGGAARLYDLKEARRLFELGGASKITVLRKK